MVEETIEERGDRGRVTEQLAPVIDGPVRCQERRGPFIAPHDHLEEVFGGGVRELAHAEVVDDEQGDRRQLDEEGLAGAVERGVCQLLEQRVRFAIEHAVALMNGGPPDGLGEMTLACARRAEEEDVFPLQDEAPGRQLVDERAIHLLVEIEVKGVEGAVGIAKPRLLEPARDEPVLPPEKFIADQRRDEIDRGLCFRLGLA